jgi:2-haloacid dehalogenase
MKYDLILFDADGTLFDFDKAEKTAFDKTLREFRITENLDYLHQEYEKINKAIWQDFQNKKISSTKLRTERFRLFAEKFNLKLNPIKISPVYLENLSKGVDLLDGAEKLVEYCFGKMEIALATNGLSDVQRPRFAASNLAKYFIHIFISEEIGHPKPDKKYFEYIFKELPQTKNAMIIGDNLTSDIKGGNDFGIDTCWFNQNKRINTSGIIPTYEISDLDELKKILV